MTADGDPKIIPFGKYKGRLVEEVLVDDPNYLQWLAGQDWFRAKFNILHQVIINRGAEPEETPDHNAMQVKFLDDDFCVRFMRCLEPKIDENVRSKLNEARESGLRQIRQRIAYISQPNSYCDKNELQQLQRAQPIFSIPFNEVIFKVGTRKFEEQGVDVILGIYADNTRPYDKPGRLGLQYDYQWREVYWADNFKIELKPIVSDDYPAVLRQMKANGSEVLFVGEYRGQGASQEQFVKTMATAGIRVVFAHDIGAAQCS
jgi:uncharacterized protein (DUF3820 family)